MGQGPVLMSFFSSIPGLPGRATFLDFSLPFSEERVSVPMMTAYISFPPKARFETRNPYAGSRQNSANSSFRSSVMDDRGSESAGFGAHTLLVRSRRRHHAPNLRRPRTPSPPPPPPGRLSKYDYDLPTHSRFALFKKTLSPGPFVRLSCFELAHSTGCRFKVRAVFEHRPCRVFHPFPPSARSTGLYLAFEDPGSSITSPLPRRHAPPPLFVARLPRRLRFLSPL